jgi:shikimate dehydrogenase
MTRKYAVIGDPVSLSLSPLMHQRWIADHGLDATYEALLVRSDNAVATIRGFDGYAGVNVTAPHKRAAAEAADNASASVKALNAANTLTWSNGAIRAENTDVAGFAQSLDEAAPEWRGAENALVIGAGGAGRGVALALAGQAVLRVTIVNRTVARAEAAGEMISQHCTPGAEARPWGDLADAFAEADLIVNTSSLGMNGSATFAWPIESARNGTVVADIVYRPLETDLLRGARARGLKTIDGVGMLIHQGALSFEIWHGIKPDTAKARERLMAALSA